MLFAHDFRFQDTGSGIQRVYRRIEALFRDLSGKYGLRIQVCKRRSRSRVRQVIGRYVYGLNRCDGTVLRGSDSLLEFTYFVCQRRLITYCGRHTSQQRRYFGAGLYETEDVVDKQEHVLMLNVTEIFRHGQSCLSDSHTRAWRFVHLTEYQGRLIDYAGLCHFVPEVVTFTGTFAYTGKDGIAAVLRSDIRDELLDQYGLAYAGTAEEADLTALGIRRQQVDRP